MPSEAYCRENHRQQEVDRSSFPSDIRKDKEGGSQGLISRPRQFPGTIVFVQAKGEIGRWDIQTRIAPSRVGLYCPSTGHVAAKSVRIGIRYGIAIQNGNLRGPCASRMNVSDQSTV
jgi:hypothetical protein